MRNKRLMSFLNSDNWNIGFVDQDSDDLIESRKLKKITWMKHHYRDRFFADPFVLKADDNAIIVFAEEYEFAKGKGILVELEVDSKTKQLLNRRVLLELPTHLSYPIIRFSGEKVLVYPENCASGELSLYEYNPIEHNLKFRKKLISEALADATIVEWRGKSYLFATRAPLTQEDLHVFMSDSFESDYSSGILVVKGRMNARQGGNFFTATGRLFRPAQNCKLRYGSGIEIMEVKEMCGENYHEAYLFSIKPQSFVYSFGIHTLNFYDGGCVVDGYGYLYPVLGRVLGLCRKMKNKLFKATWLQKEE